MYISAEHLAVANQAVAETFAQTSVAWQSIPYWYTGDPGQRRVRDDKLTVPTVAAGVLPIVSAGVDFDVTLAVTEAATPDALLAAVIAQTAELAAQVDDTVVWLLSAAGGTVKWDDADDDKLVGSLIDARVLVEQAGYRSPSCLLTDTAGLKRLSKIVGGYPVTDAVLAPPNINSLHRVDDLVNPTLPPPPPKKKPRAILLGRRQRIPHGAAADASPGEEPVDIAVSVPPSLEVVGENGTNAIAMTVRINYALRIKDARGVAVLKV
jgi:hypothetical protein